MIKNLLKTLLVITLASAIAFIGIAATNYWLQEPISFKTVIAALIAYFAVLSPTVKYWSGFLVYVAEYKKIKEDLERRKAVIEKFQNDMNTLANGNEQDKKRIADEFKQRVDDIVTKVNEKNEETENDD